MPIRTARRPAPRSGERPGEGTDPFRRHRRVGRGRRPSGDSSVRARVFVWLFSGPWRLSYRYGQRDVISESRKAACFSQRLAPGRPKCPVQPRQRPLGGVPRTGPLPCATQAARSRSKRKIERTRRRRLPQGDRCRSSSSPRPRSSRNEASRSRPSTRRQRAAPRSSQPHPRGCRPRRWQPASNGRAASRPGSGSAPRTAIPACWLPRSSPACGASGLDSAMRPSS